MSLSRSELLEVADVAYRNIVETGIGQALADAGYTEERRLAALQQVAALQVKREEQQAARGQRQAFTQQLQEALEARRGELTAFRQAVRAADRLGSAKLYTRLNLKGSPPRSYGGFVAQAKTIYYIVQNDSDMLQAVSSLGYTSVRLGELLQALADLEALNRQQEKAKGDYLRLTQEVEALEKTIQDDLTTLKAIIRVVFVGETAEGVLESLRLS